MRHMVANGAAHSGTGKPMMAGHMAGNPANNRALDAARLGSQGCSKQGGSQGQCARQTTKMSHLKNILFEIGLMCPWMPT
jgi:hypothetical protein